MLIRPHTVTAVAMLLVLSVAGPGTARADEHGVIPEGFFDTPAAAHWAGEHPCANAFWTGLELAVGQEVSSTTAPTRLMVGYEGGFAPGGVSIGTRCLRFGLGLRAAYAGEWRFGLPVRAAVGSPDGDVNVYLEAGPLIRLSPTTPGLHAQLGVDFSLLALFTAAEVFPGESQGAILVGIRAEVLVAALGFLALSNASIGAGH